MKQGKPVINLVMIALALALCAYFGVYIVNSLDTPYSSTLAYEYTLYDSVEAQGLLVRQETVLPGQQGIVEVTRTEGERVGKGQTVALVYRDAEAQADQDQLEDMKLEYDLLGLAMGQGTDVESSARLDENIIQAMVSLRDCAARSDYGRLEELVRDVKSGILKRGYTYGDGLTAQELEQKRKDLKNEMNALGRQTSRDISRVTVAQAGTFSAFVDGMEQVITPANMTSFTPEQLLGMVREGGDPDPSAVGKLITSERWYYAAVIPACAAARLKVEEYVTLRFTGDFNEDVLMRVESLGPPQEDRVAAVFSSDRYLARTTLLRDQSAELIFDHSSGLRVPKEALRMVKESYPDQETGEEVPYNRLGVYVIVAGRTEFKDVEVLSEGEDYFVVKAKGTGRTMLRAGDEVITRATGLFAGQEFKD